MQKNFVDKVNFYQDDRMGSLMLNGHWIIFYQVSTPRDNGFDYTTQYTTKLANIFNQSNPIDFTAKTIKGMVSRIIKHKYQLVKF